MKQEGGKAQLLNCIIFHLLKYKQYSESGKMPFLYTVKIDGYAEYRLKSIETNNNKL